MYIKILVESFRYEAFRDVEACRLTFKLGFKVGLFEMDIEFLRKLVHHEDMSDGFFSA